jgi:voltage-gated potassium channel
MNEIKRKMKIYLLLFLLIAAIGTFGFMNLKHVSLMEAFYFNIVTMSTVGYGNAHAEDNIGRLFTIFLIVAGGSAFLGVIANATELVVLKRDSYNRIRKVNMVMGVFFSEVGDFLLRLFYRHHKADNRIGQKLLITPGWTREQFAEAGKNVAAAQLGVVPDNLNLSELSVFLKSKRDFLVGLLENPVLVEHEGFSEALLAVFHLQDELNCRTDFAGMPDSDRDHLTGDMNRAYGRLAQQWLIYLEHLKDQYPYIFSLAVRKNPFNPDADPVVKTSA